MRKLDPRPIYYCYALFDWMGVPRYIGKGKDGGKREESHEKKSDSLNWMKNEFIEQTWIMLGEVPKIITRNGISEAEALRTETTLIRAIGRIDQGTGPLTNMTNGGDGMSGYRLSDASKRNIGTAKQNWWKETNIEPSLKKMSEAAQNRWANMTDQERIDLGRKMSAGRTPEQWKEILNRINKAQANNPERKRQQLLDNWNNKTPEEQQTIVKRMRSGQTPGQNRNAALRMTASLTPEQRHDKAIKAWKTRRLNAVRKILLRLVCSRICNSGADLATQTSSPPDPTTPRLPESEPDRDQLSDA